MAPNILTRCKIAWENHKLSHATSLIQPEVITSISAPRVQRQTVFRVSEHTVPMDTISCILTHGTGHVIALNFANAMFPGGAYLLGGDAQEESLCRASLLYDAIRTAKAYYWRNRLHVLPDYTHTMIYSPDVPVIRNNDGELLAEQRLCSFITCPAVNRTFARFLFSQKHISAVMEQRITNIIMLAASKNPDVLILGAFGCGVFGNRRDEVFPLFEHAINLYLPDSVKILFAVPDSKSHTSNEWRNYDV